MVLLVFFGQIALLGQLNLPLKFNEDVIKWSELSWMEGQNKKDQWLFLSSPPIVKEDTLYLFLNYYQKEFESGKNYGYCGYKIKKLNVKTGQKYWETTRLYKQRGNRKILSQPKFTGSNIEIPLYDEVFENGTIWNECYPAHITLDRLTGNIIDSNYVDKTDTQLPKLRSFGDAYFAGSTRPTLFKLENGYIHIRSALGLFDRTLLNLEGKIIKKDSIKYPPYKYLQWDMIFKQVENDSLWVVMFNRAQNWADIQVLLSKYDKGMKLDTTFDLSRHFAKPYDSGGIFFTDNGYFDVGTNYFNLTTQTKKVHEYAFDINGRFVDSISYTLRPDTDATKRYLWLRPIVDRVNSRLLMTQSYQKNLTQSTFFEIYANDKDSTKIVSKLQVQGIKDHFRIDYATMLDNGDILIYIHQFTDPTAAGDRWHSLILMDGQKLNIISSTKDELISKNNLKLYPNPTSEIVRIENLEAPASIIISNINGQIVKQLNNVQSEVNISDLPSGMYIFDIRNKEISERHKIVKVE